MSRSIRELAQLREQTIKQSLDRLTELLGKSRRPNYPPQTWAPSGVITPPYVPIPNTSTPLPPIASVSAGSVEAVQVELIPTMRLSLSNTKDIPNIDTGAINMAITQEDKQASEQVEEDEEEEQLSDLETVEQVKKRLRDKLIPFQQENQRNPRRIRISAHNLIPLARHKLIDTVLYLHGTKIIIEPDSEIGDDIQCDA